MWQAILIFTGLSLDSFIVMMQHGAGMRELSAKKLFGYSSAFAVVSALMFAIGYGVSSLIQKFIGNEIIEIAIGALIIFCIGVFQITKSFMKESYEEKLDRNFNVKALLRQALYTSIDIFFVGAAYSFYGTAVFTGELIAFLITFAAVFIALLIGYNLGAQYQRPVGMAGGYLMVLFAIYIISRFVLVR